MLLLQLQPKKASSSSSPSSSRKKSFQIVKAVFRGLQRHSKHGDHGYKPLEDEERSSSSSSNGGRVPRGYVAVYVGDQQEQEQKRFLVKTEQLHHPIFKALLKRSEEEFNFCHKGALLIPCQVDLFQLLLCHIENDDMVLDSSQAEELVNLYILSLQNQQFDCPEDDGSP